MQFYRNIKAIPDDIGPTAVTIGNFDGVHLGHQWILKKLKLQANLLNLSTCVVTFEPLPAQFFNVKETIFRLTLLRQKYNMIQEIGIDQLLCIKFNQDFCDMTSENFIDEVLVKKLKTRYLLVGKDFCFGYQRQGNVETLKQAGSLYNFTVDCPDDFTIHQQRVSSTWIRNVLYQGDFKQAQVLLGRAWFIEGRVQSGDRLGQTLGFPTANLHFVSTYNYPPVRGVYVVKVKVKDQWFDAIANVGVRPSMLISQPKLKLEIHILNFNENIYGEWIKVEFLTKLRDEKKFASLKELKQAIEYDRLRAQQFLTML